MICQLYMIYVMPVLPLVLQFDLAQFFIQNGLKIFGEDIISLCGESPMSSDNGKKSAFTSKGGIGIAGKQSPSLPGAGGDDQMVQQSTC